VRFAKREGGWSYLREVSMSRLTLDSTVRRSPDVVFRELDGEAVLVNLNRGTCFTLDRVGTRIWQLLGQPSSLSDILQELTSEFEVEEAAAANDLLDVVADLVARELVASEG
jgi:hypothetical protein